MYAICTDCGFPEPICSCPSKADAIAQQDVGLLVKHLRKELSHEAIPDELKALKGWVVWKVTEIQANGKFNKIPFYPAGVQRFGAQGSPEDRAQLGTFDEAMTAFKRGRYAGIGLAMLSDWGLVGFDVDRCIDEGVLSYQADQLTEGTYREVSPSGTGVRAFWRGTATNGKASSFELYTKNQFLTITGSALGGTLSDLTDDKRAATGQTGGLAPEVSWETELGSLLALYAGTTQVWQVTDRLKAGGHFIVMYYRQATASDGMLRPFALPVGAKGRDVLPVDELREVMQSVSAMDFERHPEWFRD